MKIESGRYYRTRSGRKVGPISRSGDPEYPWMIPGLATCSDDGITLIGHKRHLDLVARWSDAPAAPQFRPGDEITLRVAAVLNDGRPIVETVPDLPCDGVIPTGNVLRHVAAPNPIEVGDKLPGSAIGSPGAAYEVLGKHEGWLWFGGHHAVRESDVIRVDGAAEAAA